MSTRYYHQDLHRRQLPTPSPASFSATAAHPPTRKIFAEIFRRGMGATLERHPFSGPIH